MSAARWDVTSEAAAELFERFVNRAVAHAAQVAEGLVPRASEEGWAPVLDAWQAFQQAQAEHQEAS
ncbi:hypothetical protein SAMN04488550_4185 [Gordonia malaquae]|uniref:hypothetical protein n=1 Tax=Gordonia malaquae TaxID=410332 RepID=UPI0003457229|nr:hypothetical protein [Gordonia malaquae]SEE27108.1 hypothetical protein SAMN04488550_4185 [Gordonia malaquae]